jgi:hypothetical protein
MKITVQHNGERDTVALTLDGICGRQPQTLDIPLEATEAVRQALKMLDVMYTFTSSVTIVCDDGDDSEPIAPDQVVMDHPT